MHIGAGNMVSNCCINIWPGRSKLAHPPRVWWGPGWRGTCIECSQENKTNWEENGANPKRNIKKWNVRKFVPQKFELWPAKCCFHVVWRFFSRSTPWILNDSYVESGNLDFLWWMASADKHCKVSENVHIEHEAVVIWLSFSQVDLVDFMDPWYSIFAKRFRAGVERSTIHTSWGERPRDLWTKRLVYIYIYIGVVEIGL